MLEFHDIFLKTIYGENTNVLQAQGHIYMCQSESHDSVIHTYEHFLQ